MLACTRRGISRILLLKHADYTSYYNRLWDTLKHNSYSTTNYSQYSSFKAAQPQLTCTSLTLKHGKEPFLLLWHFHFSVSNHSFFSTVSIITAIYNWAGID